MTSEPLLICLYGPESVGKTTLARQLADHYGTVYVPEVARDLITSNELTPADYERIGYAQTAAIQAARTRANGVLICDTDVITTIVYAETYLGAAPAVLFELEKEVCFDQYFLLHIDVPWVADGLRDLGHRRQEMFDRFRQALAERNRAYTLVMGDWNRRRAIVTAAIDEHLRARSLGR